MRKVIALLYLICLIFSSCSMKKKLSYDKYNRKINFSGYEWVVKNSDEPVGPGPNFFSDDSNSVWVDQNGFLHLKMRMYNGIWHCAEIVSQKTFGYGNYEFIIDSDLGNLDRNIVLGLFTWDDRNRHNHREIDIEFAKWGSQTSNLNAQYVIQPYDTPKNRYRYNVSARNSESNHSFTWTSKYIYFKSKYKSKIPDSKIQNDSIEWMNIGSDILPSKYEKTRINLWLLTGKKPVNNKEIEIIIKEFNFTPITQK